MSAKLFESGAKRLLRSPIPVWLYAVFFLSGFCGLVYEIVWVRMLGTALGNTVYAVNLVLLMFFGGLALGSRLAVGLRRWFDDKLWMYLWLELGISVAAILSPTLLAAVNHWSLSTGWSAELSLQRILLRLVGSGLVMLLPTTLMGATLPVLSAFTVGQEPHAARKVGQLYFINTIGGALGSIICAFIGLRFLGIRTTIYVTAALNLGLAAWVWGRTRTSHDTPPAESPALTVTGLPRSWLFLYLLLGFAAIMLQILWTHILSSVFRNTIYSFACILGVFLTGVALGSRWGSRIMRDPGEQIGRMQTAIALYTLLVMIFFPELSRLILQPDAPVDGFGLILAREMGMAAIVLLVPTLMMGATFPLMVQVLHQRFGNVLVATGQAYFYNTLGGILAPFVGGFWLLGWFGAKVCMLVTAVIFLSVGLKLLLANHARWRLALVVGLVVALIAAVPESLTIYLTGDEKQVMARHESLSGTVTVVEKKDGSLVLKVNNSYAMGAQSGVFSERRQGHFPLLLHEHPRKALLIGLGTGDTLGSMSQYPLDRLDCIEILPGVISLSPYFSATNDHVGNKPGVHIMLGDGKNYVQTARDRYDVIIGDLYHPDYAGVSALYSFEHFQAARERLEPGGFYFQWLPLYQVDRQDVADITYTFRQVFPYVDLWLADYNARMPIIGLRGFRDPPGRRSLAVNSMEEIRKNDTLRARLEEVSLYSPTDITNTFLGDDTIVKQIGRAGRLNSDDHPRIEFNAPLHSSPSRRLRPGAMIDWLLQIREQVTAQSFPDITDEDSDGVVDRLRVYRGITTLLGAITRFSEGQLPPAQDGFIEALTLAPQDRNIYGLTVYHAMLALQDGQYAYALSFLDRVSKLRPDEPTVEHARGNALVGLGRYHEAIPVFKRVLTLDPTFEPGYRSLVGLFLRTGRTHEARTLFEEAHRRFPNEPFWQWHDRQP